MSVSSAPSSLFPADWFFLVNQSTGLVLALSSPELNKIDPPEIIEANKHLASESSIKEGKLGFLSLVSTATHAVTNTVVAVGKGIKDNLINRRDYSLVMKVRQGLLRERWTIGEDGFIYSAAIIDKKTGKPSIKLFDRDCRFMVQENARDALFSDTNNELFQLKGLITGDAPIEGSNAPSTNSAASNASSSIVSPVTASGRSSSHSVASPPLSARSHSQKLSNVRRSDLLQMTNLPRGLRGFIEYTRTKKKTLRRLAPKRQCCGALECEKCKIPRAPSTIQIPIINYTNNKSDTIQLSDSTIFPGEFIGTIEAAFTKPPSDGTTMVGDDDDSDDEVDDNKSAAEKHKSRDAAEKDANKSRKSHQNNGAFYYWKIELPFASFVSSNVSQTLSDMIETSKLLSDHQEKKSCRPSMDSKEAEESLKPINFTSVYDYKTIWTDEGSGAKTEVAIHRPSSSLPYSVWFSDIITVANRKPPTMKFPRLIALENGTTAADAAETAGQGGGVSQGIATSPFAKPTKFLFVWHKKRGKKSLWVWRPMCSAPEYVAIGHVATITPDPPSIKDPQFASLRLIHRALLQLNTNAYSMAWKDQGTGGRDGAFFTHPDAPLLIVSQDHLPSSSAIYSWRADAATKDAVLAVAYYGSAVLDTLPSSDIKETSGDAGWKSYWDDKGLVNLTARDCSAWRPKCDAGFVRFGDIIVEKYLPPSFPAITVRDHPAFAPPIGYRHVNTIVYGSKRAYVYHPIPPSDDYLALGVLIMPDQEQEPSCEQLRVVHRSLLRPGASIELLWYENAVSLLGPTNTSLWQIKPINTLWMRSGGHEAPPAPYLRLPASVSERDDLKKAIELRGSLMITKLRRLLEAGFESIRQTTALPFSPKQLTFLLNVIRTVLLYSNDNTTPTNNNALTSSDSVHRRSLFSSFRFSADFVSCLNELIRYVEGELSLVKKMIYDKIAGLKGLGEHEITLETLLFYWPLIKILPPYIQSIDNPNKDWSPSPSFKGPRPFAIVIFDLISTATAVRFGNVFLDLPLSESNALLDGADKNSIDEKLEKAEREKERNRVKAVMEKLSILKSELDSTLDQTEDGEICRLYCEFYHRHIINLLSTRLRSEFIYNMSDILTIVLFIQDYQQVIEDLLIDHENELNAKTEQLEREIEGLMDQYDILSKKKILSWIGNLIDAEKKAKPELEDRDADDGVELNYYYTSGMQDLFTNLNQLFDNACASKVKGQALARIGLQYAQMITLYQQSIIGYLKTIPITEKEENESVPSSSTPSSSKPSTPVLSPRPYLYFIAQINNTEHGEQHTNELKDSIIKQCEDTLSENFHQTVAQTFEEVAESWTDVATTATDRLSQWLVSLFHSILSTIGTSDYNAEGFKQTLFSRLHELISSIRDGLCGSRDAFFKTFLKATINGIISDYLRSIIKAVNHLSNSVSASLKEAFGLKKESSANSIPAPIVSLFSEVKDHSSIFLELFSEYNQVFNNDKTFIEQRLSFINAAEGLAMADVGFIEAAFSAIKKVWSSGIDIGITLNQIVYPIIKARSDLSSEDKKKIYAELGIHEKSTASTKSNNSSTSSITPAPSAIVNNKFGFSLFIESGENLSPKDSGSTPSSDPFVVVYLLGIDPSIDANSLTLLQKKKTKTIQKNLNPKWNENIIGWDEKNIRLGTVLYLEVFDEDFVGDDFMGATTIDLKEIKTIIETKLMSSSTSNDPIDRYPINFSLELGTREKHLKYSLVALKKKTEKDLHTKKEDNIVSGRINIKVDYYPLFSIKSALSSSINNNNNNNNTPSSSVKKLQADKDGVGSSAPPPEDDNNNNDDQPSSVLPPSDDDEEKKIDLPSVSVPPPPLISQSSILDMIQQKIRTIAHNTSKDGRGKKNTTNKKTPQKQTDEWDGIANTNWGQPIINPTNTE